MLYQFDKNMLINGENIDGLKLMEGLVSYDFILLDPPYRKENKSSIYNDRLEKLQWIADNKERLVKAHSFLKEDGAIAIHIDDKEYASLRMIMDEVFGETNYVNTFISKMDNENSNNQFSNATSLNRAFEFLVVYRKSEQFYYKNPYKESTNKGHEGYWDSFKSISDKSVQICPIDGVTLDKGQWRWSKERGLRGLHNYRTYQERYEGVYSLRDYWESYKDNYEKETGNDLEFVRKHKKSAQYWVKPSDRDLMDTTVMGYSISENAGIQEYGPEMVKKLDMTKKIISIFTNKDSKILDFYAESGTTAHAVMELNKEDDGKRQFTLITNDENQNCSTICKLRIDEVTKKYNENYQYLIIE